MGWKKMIFGEKMPDKDDPKYKERYEKEVAAGRKTARILRLDKAAGAVQRFACHHPRWFLAIVFGIVLACLGHNIHRIVAVYQTRQVEKRVTATEHQEQLLKQRHKTYDANRTN